MISLNVEGKDELRGSTASCRVQGDGAVLQGISDAQGQAVLRLTVVQDGIEADKARMQGNALLAALIDDAEIDLPTAADGGLVVTESHLLIAQLDPGTACASGPTGTDMWECYGYFCTGGKRLGLGTQEIQDHCAIWLLLIAEVPALLLQGPL